MRTRDKELNDFLYGGRYPRGFPAGCERQLMRKLQMLKAAHELHDLKIPPGNRLEPLKGNLKGHWSIRVNQQWRLVFQWDDVSKEATDVYFDDYHD
ncbi:type II toxin-antitoxin system RelE/ParE family toxin [Bifidobacterium miconisargentati]|uniref:type II toxin-antitoxin system RelE/ParE family toxin n=1 Tax=Bifidobacterium miconisargentati TaxID=2834437 RepID=UPI001BDC141F|nr:type II toxin-antitoxin system RelE/ParE family toxin [Bifidobacterium miconisargentati]MBW3090165.1 type II toxin-antitoxin system RelE/ParE family toxin [Bifidobacterium miconisargentati]